MKPIYLNRALSIIYLFVKNNFSHISNWLVPATICFSIPLLFLKLKKRIVFYDFGFDPYLAIDKKSNNEKWGILVFDYFGREWEYPKLEYLKGYFDCVIHDCCLSFPVMEVKSLEHDIADLTIYSTGAKKPVDIGFGGIGYYKEGYDLNYDLTSCTYEPYSYDCIEQEWKKCLTRGKRYASEEVLLKSWIDISDNLVRNGYVQTVNQKVEQAKAFKFELNNVYDNLIPTELKCNNLSNVWRYNIAVDNRKALLGAISDGGLFVSTHYANAARVLGYDTYLRYSTIIEKSVVNLFNDFYYDVQKAEKTADIIRKLYKNSVIKPVNLGQDSL